MEQRLSSPRQPLAQRLAFGGLFLALGILFPLLFHLLPARSGEIFLPMHIPVILAGMVLGPALGAAVGALTPLLNTLVGSMPPPARLPFMMVELGVYALAAGLCYRKARLPLPLSLAVTQLAGRAAYGSACFRGDAAACPGGRAHRGCHRRRQGLAGHCGAVAVHSPAAVGPQKRRRSD